MRKNNEGIISVYDETSGQYILMAKHKKMPCGNTATIEDSGSYPAYRCNLCSAIEGSIGMPKDCSEHK